MSGSRGSKKLVKSEEYVGVFYNTYSKCWVARTKGLTLSGYDDQRTAAIIRDYVCRYRKLVDGGDDRFTNYNFANIKNINTIEEIPEFIRARVDFCVHRSKLLRDHPGKKLAKLLKNDACLAKYYAFARQSCVLADPQDGSDIIIAATIKTKAGKMKQRDSESTSATISNSTKEDDFEWFYSLSADDLLYVESPHVSSPPTTPSGKRTRLS
jgi:hypothetical protein